MMKWTYSIKNKLAASVVLLALCLLVLLSHILDRVHTENVKQSISTMYEDRLIVEEYILKMTRNIYQIRELVHSHNDHGIAPKGPGDLISEIKTTYGSFIQTKLTANEAITAEQLSGQIKQMEQEAIRTNNVSSALTDSILSSLSRLSNIQLEESKQIMKEIESQYATIKTSSQFAFAIVIIILIVLQILVFSGKSLIPIQKPTDPSNN